jgi:hypothetical protein
MFQWLNCRACQGLDVVADVSVGLFHGRVKNASHFYSIRAIDMVTTRLEQRKRAAVRRSAVKTEYKRGRALSRKMRVRRFDGYTFVARRVTRRAPDRQVIRRYRLDMVLPNRVSACQPCRRARADLLLRLATAWVGKGKRRSPNRLFRRACRWVELARGKPHARPNKKSARKGRLLRWVPRSLRKRDLLARALAHGGSFGIEAARLGLAVVDWATWLPFLPFRFAGFFTRSGFIGEVSRTGGFRNYTMGKARWNLGRLHSWFLKRARRALWVKRWVRGDCVDGVEELYIGWRRAVRQDNASLFTKHVTRPATSWFGSFFGR